MRARAVTRTGGPGRFSTVPGASPMGRGTGGWSSARRASTSRNLALVVRYIEGIARHALAWSRILDTTEIVVALNLSPDARTDSITVDPALTPPGATLLNLYNPEQSTTACTAPDGRTAIRLTLPAYSLAILAKPH